MVGISGLWVPIVLSAVAVFVMSSLIHMVLGWHKGEYHELPGGEGVADAIRAAGVAPGEHIAPYAGSPAAMNTPEFKARLAKGPNFLLTVRDPSSQGMGGMMTRWFVYSLVVALFTAYVTGRSLNQSATYLQVFRLAGATTFIAYGMGVWQHWIWWGKSLRSALTTTLDALIYALLTAGIFGWRWPHA
jgi:hypothetical protein